MKKTTTIIGANIMHENVSRYVKKRRDAYDGINKSVKITAIPIFFGASSLNLYPFINDSAYASHVRVSHGRRIRRSAS